MERRLLERDDADAREVPDDLAGIEPGNGVERCRKFRARLLRLALDGAPDEGVEARHARLGLGADRLLAEEAQITLLLRELGATAVLGVLAGRLPEDAPTGAAGRGDWLAREGTGARQFDRVGRRLDGGSCLRKPVGGLHADTSRDLLNPHDKRGERGGLAGRARGERLRARLLELHELDLEPGQALELRRRQRGAVLDLGEVGLGIKRINKRTRARLRRDVAERRTLALERGQTFVDDATQLELCRGETVEDAKRRGREGDGLARRVDVGAAPVEDADPSERRRAGLRQVDRQLQVAGGGSDRDRRRRWCGVAAVDVTEQLLVVDRAARSLEDARVAGLASARAAVEEV